MDLNTIKSAVELGNATIELMKEEPAPIVNPPPVVNDRIKVTRRRFSPDTGEEVEPVVEIIYKRNLLSEREGLENQKKAADERIAAIDSLLESFI